MIIKAIEFNTCSFIALYAIYALYIITRIKMYKEEVSISAMHGMAAKAMALKIIKFRNLQQKKIRYLKMSLIMFGIYVLSWIILYNLW